MSAKHIFVDANIFLNFYRYSSDDLEEVGKLKTLIERGEIVLYLPDQVVFEFERNRDSVISESYKKFLDLKFDQSFPYICKTYTEYDIIRDTIKSFNKTKKVLEEKLNIDIAGSSLMADITVKELFQKAKKIIVPQLIIERAVVRYQRGNPPKKNDHSYGDAINWETLLENVPLGTDLFFISDDKDFKSPVESNNFNSFLLKEWKEKKSAGIIYYSRLSSFFLENYPEIKLREEEEKERLINELAQSKDFASTHNIIYKLSKFGGLSSYHIRQLIDVAISNNQVYWIADDKDINAFYLDIIKGKEGLFDENTRAQFAQYFMKENLLDNNLNKNEADSSSFF